MLRHRGKNRTAAHNLKLASLLSFVAGIVNVCGFFAFRVLTTNVTGHYAYFADNIVRKNYSFAFYTACFLLSFLSGAFTSNTLVEITLRKNKRYASTLPVAVEICLISIVAFSSKNMVLHYPYLLSCILLFAMGLQNALVTKISSSVVRTTHLTGLFTDLGIELSQLIFYWKKDQKKTLVTSVNLRFAIIGFFFAGCIIGGFGFLIYDRKILIPAILCLTGGLIFDNVKYKIRLIKKKIKQP